MKAFIDRWISKKLLVALGTSLTLIGEDQYYAAMGVAIAYITVQGGVDLIAILKKVTSELED